MAVIPGWVHVDCPHGTLARFVVTAEGRWKGLESGAEQVEERWRFPLRCERCRLNVPVAHMDLIGSVLDRLIRTNNPAVRRVSPIAVSVPLKLVADAIGAPRAMPD